MVVKTITITEDAYEKMRRLKREDESFSKLFLRLSGEKRSTAKSLYGILKGEDTEKLLEASADFRKRADRDMERRKRVFARQFSSIRANERRKKK